MTVSDRMERLVRAAARRPVLTLALFAVLAAVGGALALGLQPSTGYGTFVGKSTATYKATQDDETHFGGDPVIVLIKEPLSDLVLTKELATVTKLEACLAGQTVVASSTVSAFVPAKPGTQKPYGGQQSPCGQLMRDKPVQVVYGPGTFLNRSVAAVNSGLATIEKQYTAQVKSVERSAYLLALGQHRSVKQALTVALAAGKLEEQQESSNLAQMYVQSGIKGMPQIDDTDFISQIVFDATRGPYQPKARFAYLFPTTNSALIQIRLKASLSTAQQARAIALIRQAVKMPMFASAYKGTYTVSGAPVVLNDLSDQLSHSIAIMLLVALGVMALVLALVFRSRLRLLPLVLALGASGITFGISALLGASLTMASIAVLPVLIGLAVDYGVQFQSRVQEARRAQGGALDSREAVVQAALVGAPAIGVAALATAAGFLVLLLSPVPMVRGFALLLVLGIGVALLCALCAGSAAMVLADGGGGAVGAALRGAGDIVHDLGRPLRALHRRPPRPEWPGRRRPRAVGLRRWRPSPPGLRRRRADRRGSRLSLTARALSGTLRSPWRIIAVGAVIALFGWVADTQTAVQSDLTKLVPSSMPALRDLRQLERLTGVSGEIDVVVHARDVGTPQTIKWMVSYEQQLFNHYGYLETKGCAHSTVCPGLSLPDLFSAGSQSSSAASSSLTRATINSLLSAVPSYFREAVITPDEREATLAFGIRLMPLSRQQQVIDYMRSQLHPPAGVTAQLAGLPVLAAEADGALSSSPRRMLTLLAGVLVVGLALLLFLRRLERVLVPLVPIVLATGWSALILFLIGIPLNPMSATLGALVIAISTEFSVLLSERYHQERARGADLPAALRATYRSTGRAVLVSGLTAIAGFGVLVVSDITMLRDFGFVTLIDLTVSLAGVLLVLPAVFALAERGHLREDLLAALHGAASAVPRPRRRARVA